MDIDQTKSMKSEHEQQWHYEEIASQGAKVQIVMVMRKWNGLVTMASSYTISVEIPRI